MKYHSKRLVHNTEGRKGQSCFMGKENYTKVSKTVGHGRVTPAFSAYLSGAARNAQPNLSHLSMAQENLF